jgi:hypothetical protein
MNWAGPALDMGFPNYWDVATLADQSEIRIENFLSFFSVIYKKERESRGT